MGLALDGVASLQIECECGRENVVEDLDGLLDCGCGRRFAITITDISDNGDWAFGDSQS